VHCTSRGLLPSYTIPSTSRSALFYLHMDANINAISSFPETDVPVTLEILRSTLLELQHASVRFTGNDHVRSSLAALSLVLGRMEERLEFFVGDEDVLQRLRGITVGNMEHQYPFLCGLAVDLQTICAHLQHASLSGGILQTDMECYAANLDRYNGILTAVWKRSKEYVLTLVNAPYSVLIALPETDKRLTERSTTRHLRISRPSSPEFMILRWVISIVCHLMKSRILVTYI
jgi:hypothetical protein